MVVNIHVSHWDKLFDNLEIGPIDQNTAIENRKEIIEKKKKIDIASAILIIQGICVLGLILFEVALDIRNCNTCIVNILMYTTLGTSILVTGLFHRRDNFSVCCFIQTSVLMMTGYKSVITIIKLSQQENLGPHSNSADPLLQKLIFVTSVFYGLTSLVFTAVKIFRR